MFRNISLFFLCALVIYTGAGVALMQLCCKGCRDMQSDHNLYCQVQHMTASKSDCCQQVPATTCCCGTTDGCDMSVADTADTDEKEACSVEVFRPDWLKLTFSPEIILPVCDLWQGTSYLFALQTELPATQRMHTGSHAPPLPGREYLALYSTLLI